MSLDRTLIPELKLPERIDITHASEFKLNNGLRVNVLNVGDAEVIKLDIIFPSFGNYRKSHLISSACHQLIDAGTPTKSAMAIAETFDYYGAYLQINSGPDWNSISLFSLARFFSETIKNLDDLLFNASFPEEEIETWKTRSLQSLQVNREKVSWLAKTAFSESLFGSSHPYGVTALEKDYEMIEAAILRKWHAEKYMLENVTLIVSGKVSDVHLHVLNEWLGTKTINDKPVVPVTPLDNNYTPTKKFIEKKDAVQSGIRIGKKLFSKNHQDFPALQIANTVLGGYFGSRLMSNIREDKGYTYGIGSGIQPYRHTGYFFISTEVGTQVKSAAVQEIFIELDKLSREPVSGEELKLVQNYLHGAFQRSLDGPFELADRFRNLVLFGLDYEYLDNYLRQIHSITPERVMEVAHKHLQPDSMTEIIAG